MDHAKYSPSKLPRIVRCPGSVKAEKPFVQKESSYAAHGTALHELTELHLLANELTVAEHLCEKVNYSISKEDKEAVQENLDYVASLKMQYAGHDQEEFVEVQVSLADYADAYNCPELNEVYGTLDYLFYADNDLYVIDWKYGMLEVFPDSEQLKAYGLGALNMLSKKSISNISLVIGQPRLYAGEHIKVYEASAKELLSWLREDLVPAARDITASEPVIRPSEKACLWCLAKNVCSSRKELAQKAAQEAFALHAEMPDNVSNKDIASFLDKLPDLKKYIKDIEQFAHNRIKKGDTIPGYKLVPGRSIRCWKNETEAKKFYFSNDDLDPDDLVVTKFKSPTQIEKLIGKRNITDEDRDLVFKPEGKPTLVKESDRREALVYENASDKFKNFVN